MWGSTCLLLQMWHSARELWFPSQLHLRFNWVDAGTKLGSTESASDLKTGNFNQRYSKKNPKILLMPDVLLPTFDLRIIHYCLVKKTPTKTCFKIFLCFPLEEEQQQNPASNLLTHISKIPKDPDKIYPIYTMRNRNSKRAILLRWKSSSCQSRNTTLSVWGILSYRRHHSHWYLSSRCVCSVIIWMPRAAGFILEVHIIASFL